jgi:hypothetical protein
MSPVRIQRQRSKDWRMPDGAIYVGRPTLWGNPWTVAEMGVVFGLPVAERRAAAVRMYRRELLHFGMLSDYDYHVSPERWDAADRAIRVSGARSMAEYVPFALRGHDLACWCPLDVPCHADVLLELANTQ